MTMKSLTFLFLLLTLGLTNCNSENKTLTNASLLGLLEENTQGDLIASKTISVREVLDLNSLPEELKPYITEQIIGTHQIQIKDVVFDKEKNTTEYSYFVKSGSSPSISHWTLGINPNCGGVDMIVSSNDRSVSWTDSDPSTGTRGIKFDTGYNDTETRQVFITLKGIYFPNILDLSIKAGRVIDYGKILGPSCESTPPTSNLYKVVAIPFFDINTNALLDTDEPKLDKILVTISDLNGKEIETKYTTNGQTDFNLPVGKYFINFSNIDGFTLENSIVTINVSKNIEVYKPYTMDNDFIYGKTANGHTIGFWKNNVSKAIEGNIRGTQISNEVVLGYLQSMETFLLAPLNFTNPNQAIETLSATSSNPIDLLSKQLVGSELNYLNGAFIEGNDSFTKLFLYKGEYMIKNQSEFTNTEILEMKDQYDAYNNSHGGEISKL
jgi:hypothetical protein